MATAKIGYGTFATLALALASVANAAGCQSDAVDNTTTLALDYALRIPKTQLTGAGAGTLDLYLARLITSGPTYVDGASGTSGSFTAANLKNAKLIDRVQMNGATSVSWGCDSLRQAIGIEIPNLWTIIAINNGGAAMNATSTNHLLEVMALSKTAA
ncbi:MAG TPA: hypothetical protein VGM50_23045 [Gemmatimonadaceae bacterium]|jgi:hypothetical protein